MACHTREHQQLTAAGITSVTDGGFRDPAGRLGLVFAVTPVKILAFGKNPYSQTRYRFTS